MSKFREIQEELKSVLFGRGARFLDSFVPLLVFLIANPILGVDYALWGALIISGLFAVFRIIRKESLVYAFGGLGGVLLAGIFVKLSGSESGFFLPGLISGGITILICVVSVVFNRPLVAWTGFIARRWPLGWYWHPKVLPAYNEVTIFWGVAFAGRLALEFWLYHGQSLNALSAVRIILGWPFIIVLLIITYLYGLWRLNNLQGPSVEEFKAEVEPPWKGQKRGF